jgi:hypothetical protein
VADPFLLDHTYRHNHREDPYRQWEALFDKTLHPGERGLADPAGQQRKVENKRQQKHCPCKNAPNEHAFKYTLSRRTNIDPGLVLYSPNQAFGQGATATHNLDLLLLA